MPSFLTDVLGSTVTAPDVEVVLDALEAAVVEVLSEHDARYGQSGRVVRHVDDAVTDARAREDRVRIMGEPARYVEMLVQNDVPDAAGTIDLASEGDESEGYQVALIIYHGIEPDADRAVVSRDFRALLWSRDAEAPGLVRALRLQGFLDHADGEIRVVVGAVTTPPLVLVDRTNREYRLEAVIPLTLTPC